MRKVLLAALLVLGAGAAQAHAQTEIKLLAFGDEPEAVDAGTFFVGSIHHTFEGSGDLHPTLGVGYALGEKHVGALAGLRYDVGGDVTFDAHLGLGYTHVSSDMDMEEMDTGGPLRGVSTLGSFGANWSFIEGVALHVAASFGIGNAEHVDGVGVGLVLSPSFLQ